MPRLRTFAPFFVLLVPALLPAADTRHTFKEGNHGPASLRYVHDVPVLTVWGTPEEMGEQIGALTGPQLNQIARYPRRLLSLFQADAQWERLVAKSRKLLPQFPADYRKEMNAVAQAAHMDSELLLVGSTFPDILKSGGCSTLIVQAKRSATREPIFGRNLDYPSMGFLQYYTLVTIYHPKGKHAFASVGFPGMIGCVSGMNDAGLALATLEVYWTKDGSPRLDTDGVPYTLCFRRLLEECGSVSQAERMLRSMKRTTMNNLAVCDRHGGAVFEFTPRNLVVRAPVDDVCCCTNHFRTQELAPTEPPRLARLKECRRYAILEQACSMPEIGVADVARKLNQVNQGAHTLQSMIFEPATLVLHLAAGQPPASALPMQTLDLALLFKPQQAKKRP